MNNYFSQVNIYEISNEEKDRVAVFLEQSNQPPPRWRDKTQWGNLQKAIGYVRIFDDDPNKAAKSCRDAIEKYGENFKKFSSEKIETLTFEEQQELGQWLDSDQDETKPIFQEVYGKSQRKARKIMEEEFDNLVYEYLDRVGIPISMD